VNIARALYYGADIVIFDDPLSAVDANVGKALFHTAIQGLVAQGKTVLLVTHALHFLSQCDYIYTLDGGRIAESGTYAELIAKGGEFARLDREFGGAEAQAQAGESEEEPQVQVVTVADVKAKSAGAEGTGKIEGRLIVKEHRTTGGVSWSGKFFSSPFLSADFLSAQFMATISKRAVAGSRSRLSCSLPCSCKGARS
jgi:ATP-binding cassette subfamily C (CFTR/MRP) protein 1